MDGITKFLVGLALAAGSLSAHAALFLVDDGKLVDDTADHTMWVADGNLFHTLANAGGDPAGFVQTVINTSHGVIADTPNELDTPANSGTYVLTSDDLHPDNGLMTWFGAKAFIHYLNSIHYAGYADWRLPVTVDTHEDSPTAVGVAPGDANPSAGELAELFYTELGGTSGASDYLSTLNRDAGLFHNLQPAYHYGTEGLAAASPSGAWVFNVGYVYSELKLGPKGTFAALPVRSGQAAVKPMISWVRGELNNGAGPLLRALTDLHEACEELTQFEVDPSTSTGAIPDAVLKSDITAIRAIIGCQ